MEAARAPDVSFVMTAWKPRPDWLLTAVQSVLDERECSLELILVDDGNDEAVADLVRDISDERLRVLRIEHGGVSRARNAGVEAARGAFIRFVDCDDYFPPGGTARLLARAGGDELVVPYGQTLRCDSELGAGQVESCEFEGRAELLCYRGEFPVWHTSILWPRRVVELVGEWDPAFPACGDWDYTLRGLEHAPVVSEPAVVTWYRNHPTSVSSNLEACSVGLVRVVKRYQSRHGVHGRPVDRWAEAGVELNLAWGYLLEGNAQEAARRLRRAAVTSPARTVRRGRGLAFMICRVVAVRTIRRIVPSLRPPHTGEPDRLAPHPVADHLQLETPADVGTQDADTP